MKGFTLLSIAALSSCSLAAVSMNIARNPSPLGVSKRHLSARATITESLGNNFTGQSYMAVVTVGTPPQNIALAIDTGSSDTWVLSTTANLCTDKEVQSEEGTGCQTPYNSKASSTFKLADSNAFHITYGDGSGVDGDYITDDLTIGGVTVKSLEMGLGISANLTQGLLGIGYALNEASDENDPPFIYPNIVTAMLNQGLISSPAYSLFLNDLEASTGSIIFGGLDTDKYHGDLVQLPIVPTTLRNGSQEFFEFGVALNSFSINKTVLTTSRDAPFEAILDSGTSLTYLPTRLAEAIFEELNAVDTSDDFESSGFVLVDCDLLSQNPSGTFDFGFGSNTSSTSGVTISVPYSEMIITQDALGIDLTGSIPSSVTFQNVCVLGLMSQSEEPFILGDTFLRSAYVVYDLQNNEISIAQTNFNSDTSNIVDFKAGETSVPLVSGVASGVSVTATVTGPIGPTKSATTTGSGSSSTGSGSSSTSGSSPAATSSKSSAGTTVPVLDLSALYIMGGTIILAGLGGGFLGA